MPMTTTTIDSVHHQIQRWFEDALRVVEPRQAVKRAVSWSGDVLTVEGESVEIARCAKVVVIAIGKAAPAMAQGAVDILGDRVSRGIILTKHGHLQGSVDGFEAFEAGHPIPDEDGAVATREVIGAITGLNRNDVVIALISGGGSALLELPREPLTLEAMQETTRLLMHAGAGIHDLNAVRRALSQVKGGGLRRLIGDARCVSLLLSDVLGNDPQVIASGPTIRKEPSHERAREIVARFGIAERLPEAVMTLLNAVPEDVALPVEDRDLWHVIADNAAMVAELERLVRLSGCSSRVQWHAYEGDAAVLGRRMVEDALQADVEMDVLLGGGEATVEVRGSGRGGRNTETALTAAIALDEYKAPWVVASLASDGDDGAADAAGAIADPETCTRGCEQGADARKTLRNNDSATYFRRTGGVVQTGPTGTNVNDVYIAVRLRDTP